MLISYSFFEYARSRTLHNCSERCLCAYTISDINETSTKVLKWAWNYTDQTSRSQVWMVDYEERTAVIAIYSKQVTCALQPSAGILCLSNLEIAMNKDNVENEVYLPILTNCV